MIVRNEEDRRAVRESGRIAAIALGFAVDLIERSGREKRKDLTTLEVSRQVAKVISYYGAGSAPHEDYCFPEAICISINNCIAHGLPDDLTVLRQGDLVNIDVSVVKEGVYADNAATVIFGKPKEEVHVALIKAARQARDLAIAEIRSGAWVADAVRAMLGAATQAGFGVVDNLCSHGTGARLHEDPIISAWPDPQDLRMFSEGQVLAIEPFVSLTMKRAVERKDGPSRTPAFYLEPASARAAQFEHTVIVGKFGSEIVTVPS